MPKGLMLLIGTQKQSKQTHADGQERAHTHTHALGKQHVL